MSFIKFVKKIEREVGRPLSLKEIIFLEERYNSLLREIEEKARKEKRPLPELLKRVG